MSEREPVIGVLADIHSNVQAFRSTVERMISEGCQEFLLLGDFVSDTAGTRETLDFLYELIGRYPCHILRGNREEYFLNYRQSKEGKESGVTWLSNSASGNLLYTYRKLTERDLAFFRNLPITFRFEKAGYPAITCCHGSPDRVNELLEFDSPRTSEVLSAIDTELLICGHTHRQGMLRKDGKTYLNTGACGLAIGDPGYAHGFLLRGENGSWIPEPIRVPYDVGETVSDLFRSGLFDMAPWFMNNNIHTLLFGIDVTPEFVKLANAYEERLSGTKPVWPELSEEAFALAAKELHIPDYRFYGNIRPAKEADRTKLLAFYGSLRGGKAKWDETYPGSETISWDLSRDALFLMENDASEIIGSISLDLDSEVEAYTCWNPELMPVGELSRIGVAKPYQQRGIGRMLVAYAMNEYRRRGKKACHLLVCPDNDEALRCYGKFGFTKAGERDLKGHHYFCFERPL